MAEPKYIAFSYEDVNLMIKAVDAQVEQIKTNSLNPVPLVKPYKQLLSKLHELRRVLESKETDREDKEDTTLH